MLINFTFENNYTIGGEIYNLPQNPKYIIERATNKTKGNITNILPLEEIFTGSNYK